MPLSQSKVGIAPHSLVLSVIDWSFPWALTATFPLHPLPLLVRLW